MEAVHDKILRIRKEKHISQLKLAQLIGVSHVTMKKIEKGETFAIPIDVCKKIADALSVDFNELFDVKNLNTIENVIIQFREEVKNLNIEIIKKDKIIEENGKRIRDKDYLINFLESEKNNLKNFFVMQFVSNYQHDIGMLNDLINDSPNEEFKIKLQKKRSNLIRFEKRMQQMYIDMKLFTKEDITSYVNDMKQTGMPFFDINDLPE